MAFNLKKYVGMEDSAGKDADEFDLEGYVKKKDIGEKEEEKPLLPRIPKVERPSFLLPESLKPSSQESEMRETDTELPSEDKPFDKKKPTEKEQKEIFKNSYTAPDERNLGINPVKDQYEASLKTQGTEAPFPLPDNKLMERAKSESEKANVAEKHYKEAMLPVYKEVFKNSRSIINSAREDLQDKFSGSTQIIQTGDPLYPQIQTNKTYSQASRQLDLADKYLDEMESVLNAHDGKGVISALKLKTKTAEDFFSLGWSKVFDNYNILGIYKKSEKGEAISEEEQLALAMYGLKSQIMSNVDTPISYDVAVGVIDMIPYMAMFAAAQPLSRGVSRATEGAITKLMGTKLGKKTVAKYANKVLSHIVGSASVTPAFPMFWEKGAQEMIGGEKPAKAYVKSFLSTLSEVGVENFMSNVFRGGIEKGLKNIGKIIQDATAWDGFIEQFGEEMVTAFFREHLIEGEPLKEVYTPDQILTTALIVGIMHGAMKGVIAVSDAAQPDIYRNRQKLIDLGLTINESTKQKIDKIIDSVQEVKDVEKAGTELASIISEGIKSEEYSKRDIAWLSEYMQRKIKDSVYIKKIKNQLNIDVEEAEKAAKETKEGKEGEVPEKEETLKKGRVEKIQSKPLTRVEGLEMGENQAEGVYVSTEKENRYATEDNPPQPVKVEVENPIEFDQNKGEFSDYQREILNKNKEKFNEGDFAEAEVPKKGKITVDDLSDAGTKKLAGIVTKDLQDKGYDSINFTGEGEGELVVFDKSKVNPITEEADLDMWEAEHTEDEQRLYELYEKGKEQAPYQGLSEWQQSIIDKQLKKLGKIDGKTKRTSISTQFNKSSLSRYLSKDDINSLAARGMVVNKGGQRIDVFAEENNTDAQEVANFLEDIIHKRVSTRKTTDLQNTAAARFRDVHGYSIKNYEPIEKHGDELYDFMQEYNPYWFKVDDIKTELDKHKDEISKDKYERLLKLYENEKAAEEEAIKTGKDIFGEKEVQGDQGEREEGKAEEGRAEEVRAEKIRKQLLEEIQDKKDELQEVKERKQKKIAEFNDRRGFFGDTKKLSKKERLFDSQTDFSQESLNKYIQPEDNQIKRLEAEIDKMEKNIDAKVKEAGGQKDLWEEESFSKEPKGGKGKKKKKGTGEKGVKKPTTKKERKTKEEPKGKRAKDWVDEDKLTNEGFMGIQFPELVQIVKKLSGKMPILKDFRRSLGKFYYQEGGDFYIALSRELFKEGNEAELGKVIAHEIGHMIDFIMDKTMRRGNILGRIASASEYMVTLLKESPEKIDNILTPNDRARFRRLAEKELKEEYNKGIREIIEDVIKEIPIYDDAVLSADDITMIWRDNEAREKNPALYQYIAGLSSAQKKGIMSKALKGLVEDEIVKKFSKAKQVGTKTIKETIKRVIYPDPVTKENIRKKYKELLNEEIQKRRLFEAEVIRDELIKLTKWWNPFDETIDPLYTEYRYRSRELYAEALSVFLNKPQELAERAPHFNRAFQNYMPTKKSFKEVYDELQELYKQPKEVLFQERLNKLYEGFKRAEQKREKIANEKKKEKISRWDRFLATLFSKNIPIYKRVPKGDTKKLEKALSNRNALRNSLEQLAYLNEEVSVFIMDMQHGVIDPLKEIGINLADLGGLLTVDRNIFRNRGGEKVYQAEPLGFLEQVDYELREFIKQKYSKEQIEEIEKRIKIFHDGVYEVMTEARDSGIISDKVFEEIIEPNKDNYATFSVVDYIDKNYISPKIKEAHGTIEEIENPFVSTVMKASSMIWLTRRNNAIKNVFNSLKEFHPDDFVLKDRESYVKDKKPLIIAEDGRNKYLYVDNYIYDAFKISDMSREWEMVIKSFGAFNKVFKPLVTTWNVGWAFYSNVFRDHPRSLLNMMTILKATKDVSRAEYLKTIPQFIGMFLKEAVVKKSSLARKFVKGELNDTLKEMMKEGALPTGFFGSYDSRANELLGPIFKQTGLIKQAQSWRQQMKERNKGVGALITVLDKIEYWGSLFEASAKINAYQLYKKKLGDKKTAAFYTRNYSGTPNYRDKGYITKVTNEVWTFSNVILQALRTDSELAFSPETASSYWMHTAIGVMAPALMVGVASIGLFGDELEELYGQISDYDKSNYLCIVFGKRDDGKPVYARVPMPEFSRIAYTAMFKAVTAIKGGVSWKDVQQLLAVGSTMTPSRSPMLTVADGWGQFIADINPRDRFYGRDILTQREYKEGGWPAIKKMLTWTIEKTGGYPIIRFFDYDPIRDKTTEHIMKNIPILNRAIKVGGYGEIEMYSNELERTDKIKAKESRKEQKVIDKYVVEALKDGKQVPGAKPYYEKVKEELYGEGPLNAEERKDFSYIKRRFNITMIYGIDSPYSKVATNLIYVSNDHKQAVVEKYMQVHGDEQARDMVSFMNDNKIISDPLKRKINRELFKDVPKDNTIILRRR